MKRHIASWMLLAVYVPMLLFSSLHIHESHHSSDTECAECVAHQCHGHIGQTDASSDDCVLCQFLSLTFVAAATAVASFIFNVSRITVVPPSCNVCSTNWGNIVTRGPPTV